MELRQRNNFLAGFLTKSVFADMFVGRCSSDLLLILFYERFIVNNFL